MRGCIQLQWNFLEDYFNVFAHFMMGDLWAHLPTPYWVFSRFWPKMAWPPCSTLPIHQISPRGTFFVVALSDEKSPKRETFCCCGKGETKNGRNTKRLQNQQIQKLLNTQCSVRRCAHKSPIMKWVSAMKESLKIHWSWTQPLTTPPAGTLIQRDS